jgi:hypothetical protein
MKEIKRSKRIVEAIDYAQYSDFYLLKSQIAQFEGNQAAALKIGMLILLCLKNNYGAMYNKYNTLIYADAKNSTYSIKNR